MLEVVRFDLRPCLASLKVPTLVLAGERDTTVPLDCTRELATRSPAAQLHVIPAPATPCPTISRIVFWKLCCPFWREPEKRKRHRLGAVSREDAKGKIGPENEKDTAWGRCPCVIRPAIGRRGQAAAALASELPLELSLLALLSAAGAAALSLDSFLPAGSTLLFLPRESVT